MDKYLLPLKPSSPQNPKPLRRYNYSQPFFLLSLLLFLIWICSLFFNGKKFKGYNGIDAPSNWTAGSSQSIATRSPACSSNLTTRFGHYFIANFCWFGLFKLVVYNIAQNFFILLLWRKDWCVSAFVSHRQCALSNACKGKHSSVFWFSFLSLIEQQFCWCLKLFCFCCTEKYDRQWRKIRRADAN